MTESQKATRATLYRSSNTQDYTIPLLYDAMTEVHALGKILFPDAESGLSLDTDIILKTLRNTSRLHCIPESTHKPSMLLGVELGRPMELNVVTGEVVRLGRKMGVAMPVSRYS